MGKCVIPVCCASSHFDYCLWIKIKLFSCDDARSSLCSYFILSFLSPLRLQLVRVLNVQSKIKDFLGLDPCNSRRAVGNLLWHHQIHDQLLILQELLLCNHYKISGLQGGLKHSVRDLWAILVIFTVLVRLFYRNTPQSVGRMQVKNNPCDWGQCCLWVERAFVLLFSCRNLIFI